MADAIHMPRWPHDLQSQLRGMDEFFTQVASVISELEEENARLKQIVEERDEEISELKTGLALAEQPERT